MLNKLNKLDQLYNRHFFFVLVMTSVLLLSGCATTTESTTGIPGSQNPSYLSAVKAMKAGNEKKAFQLLIKLVKKQPAITNAHINLAIIYIKRNQYDKARSSLLRAISLEPGNHVAHNQLGIVYRNTGEFTSAEDSYKKAISINPDYAFAHLNIGILYDLYLYDYENALQHYMTYNRLTNKTNKQVAKWIFDLKQRLKKSLARKKAG